MWHQTRQEIESKYRKRCGLWTVLVPFQWLWSSALRKSNLREKESFMFCFVLSWFCVSWLMIPEDPITVGKYKRGGRSKKQKYNRK